MKYIVLFSVIMFAFACDQKTPISTSTPKTTPSKASKGTKKTATLVIPKNGKPFKPPVAKDKIPQDAFYCDMGTVHYARMDKGDGKCPLCGMVLVKKSSKVLPSRNQQ